MLHCHTSTHSQAFGSLTATYVVSEVGPLRVLLTKNSPFEFPPWLPEILILLIFDGQKHGLPCPCPLMSLCASLNAQHCLPAGVRTPSAFTCAESRASFLAGETHHISVLSSMKTEKPGIPRPQGRRACAILLVGRGLTMEVLC